jgi:uncharacterized membrane protein YagU involved in acid resistance
MPSKTSLAAKTIFRATLVAGTLDILSALFFFGYVFGKVAPRRMLQGIASAVIGKKAFDGGVPAAFLGLLIHYCIALAFAAFFFFVYPAIPFLKKNRLAGGLLYGVFVFIVMNVVVLPLIGFRKFHFHWDSILENTLILMYAIGIPISYMVHRYYSRSRLFR